MASAASHYPLVDYDAEHERRLQEYFKVPSAEEYDEHPAWREATWNFYFKLKKSYYKESLAAGATANYAYEYARAQASAAFAERAIQVASAQAKLASALTTKAYELDNFVESDLAFFDRRRDFLVSINCWNVDMDPEAHQLDAWNTELKASRLQERTIDLAKLDAECAALDKEDADVRAVRAAKAALDMEFHSVYAARLKAAAKIADAAARDSIDSSASTPAKSERIPPLAPFDPFEPTTLFKPECVVAPLDLAPANKLDQEPYQEPLQQYKNFYSSPNYQPIVSEVMNMDREPIANDLLSTSALPYQALSTGRNLPPLSRHRDEDRKHKIHHPGGPLGALCSFFFLKWFLLAIFFIVGTQ
jgi:hypothetical protein